MSHLLRPPRISELAKRATCASGLCLLLIVSPAIGFSKNEVLTPSINAIDGGFLGVFLGPESGPALVTGTVESSPAAKMGIMAEDVITAIDGRPISTASQLRSLVGAKSAGDKVELTINRGDDVLALQVTLGTRDDGAILETEEVIPPPPPPIVEAIPDIPEPEEFAIALDDTTSNDDSGYLGVNLGASEGGAQISSVIDGTAASRSGFQAGDVITKVDGKKVNSVEELIEAVGNKKAGDEVKIEWRRQGETLRKAIKLGSRSEATLEIPQDGLDFLTRPQREDEPEERTPAPERKGYLGVALEDGGEGVYVDEVMDGSPAAKAGIQEGDQIVSINDRRVRDLEALTEAMGGTRAGQRVQVGIERDRSTMNLTVRLGQAPTDALDMDDFEIEIPEIDIPEIEIPEIDIPEIEIPEIDIPEIQIEEVPRGLRLPRANTEERGYIGVQIQDSDRGVLISQVVPSSPAAKAGLQSSDVIIGIDGREVRNLEALSSAMNGKKPGDRVSFQFLRDGTSLTNRVTLGRRGEMAPPPEEIEEIEETEEITETPIVTDSDADESGFLGVLLDQATDRGVRISGTVAGTVAEKAGLQEGDIIRAVNGRNVSSTENLVEALSSKKAGDAVEVEVIRGDFELGLKVKLGRRPQDMMEGTENEEESDEIEIVEDPIVSPRVGAQGFLGVMLGENGTDVTGTTESSAAAKAGIQAGDVITWIDENEVNSYEGVANALSGKVAGDRVRVVLERDGSQIELRIRLGARPQEFDDFGDSDDAEDGDWEIEIIEDAQEAGPGYLGVQLADANGGGALVSEVLEGTAASSAGIQNGDVIRRVGDRRIESANDLVEAIGNARAGEVKEVGLVRDDILVELRVTLGSRESEEEREEELEEEEPQELTLSAFGGGDEGQAWMTAPKEQRHIDDRLLGRLVPDNKASNPSGNPIAILLNKEGDEGDRMIFKSLESDGDEENVDVWVEAHGQTEDGQDFEALYEVIVVDEDGNVIKRQSGSMDEKGRSKARPRQKRNARRNIFIEKRLDGENDVNHSFGQLLDDDSVLLWSGQDDEGDFSLFVPDGGEETFIFRKEGKNSAPQFLRKRMQRRAHPSHEENVDIRVEKRRRARPMRQRRMRSPRAGQLLRRMGDDQEHVIILEQAHRAHAQVSQDQKSGSRGCCCECECPCQESKSSEPKSSESVHQGLIERLLEVHEHDGPVRLEMELSDPKEKSKVYRLRKRMRKSVDELL